MISLRSSARLLLQPGALLALLTAFAGCSQNSQSFEIVDVEREVTFEEQNSDSRARLNENFQQAAESDPRGSSDRAPIVVGFQSPVETALDAVMASPTVFHIKSSEDFETFERAEMFLDTYTANGVAVRHATKKGIALSNIKVRLDKRGKKINSQHPENYQYLVEKLYRTGGLTYRVKCYPISKLGRQDLAERNARNLARFLRSGQLELDLLAK